MMTEPLSAPSPGAVRPWNCRGTILPASIFALIALVLSGCGGGGSSPTQTSSATSSAPTLSSLQVSGTASSISLGGTEQLTATGTYSDGSRQNLTSSVTWSSNDANFVTITAAGLAKGVHSGSATLSAASGAVSGSTTISVQAGTALTGSMATARKSHTATLLPNGKVLIAGGGTGAAVVSTAEIYDSDTGTFSATGPLINARQSHTATLLATGLVLIAGGDDGNAPLASAELYDPSAGTFSATGSMTVSREGHTATLLPSGKVLIAGGYGTGGTPLSSAEIYDPISGTFAAAASMSTARANHAAVLLNEGRVLIAGGDDGSSALASAELFDPVLGVFLPTGAMNAARENHTMTLLDSGKVLIAGGSTGSNGSASASAELYDPTAHAFTSTGSMTTARYYHTATLLTTGQVLISGGKNESGILASEELYDRSSGTFTATANMDVPRDPFTATRLTTGSVLIAGGVTTNSTVVSIAEIFEPILKVPRILTMIKITPDHAFVAPYLWCQNAHPDQYLSECMRQFTAIGISSDGSSETLASVAWSTSDSSEVGIDSTGLARGFWPTGARITATVGSLTSAPAQVSDCLEITGSPLVVGGPPVQFFARSYCYLSDPDPLNIAPEPFDVTSRVTWTSSAPNIATVSATGLVTAVGAGNVVIQAHYAPSPYSSAFDDGWDATVYPSLASVSVQSWRSSQVLFASQNLYCASCPVYPFWATATFSNGATLDVTRWTNWTSSNSFVIDFGSGIPRWGGHSGTTGIGADFAGGHGTMQFTVPSLTAVEVVPANAQSPVGTTFSFTALDDFSDGERVPAWVEPGSATWTSSLPAVATINSSTGTASVVGEGSTTIQAAVKYTQFDLPTTGFTTFTGTPALVSIAVTPANATLKVGSSLQFTATGTFSDGSAQQLTSGWVSSNIGVATVSDNLASLGQAVALAPGSTTISTSLYGVTGSTTLTVTPSATTTYTIGGSVINLAGTGGGLQLHNNGGDTLAVNANGSFVFATALPSGSPYNVTIAAQPSNPAQICAVTNGSGSATANVTNVVVDCGHGQWTWEGGTSIFDRPNEKGVYGNLGVAAPGNIPGARSAAASWRDASGAFWLFGGTGLDSAGTYGLLNDLWKFSAGEWTWMGGSNVAAQAGTYGTVGIADPANIPGARGNAVAWIDNAGNVWLFGGIGYDSAGQSGDLNDLWQYSSGAWAWVSGSNSINQPGTYGSKGVPAPGNVPGARGGAAGWIDGSGNLWLFGGSAQSYFNDLWKYSNGEWTWVAGSNATGPQPGTYGTLGVADPANTPGSRTVALTWTDASGTMWLFGGEGYGANSGQFGYINDLWKFSNGEWTWMGGSSAINQAGVYGTLGVPASTNIPGGRGAEPAWVDGSGNLWLFGGNGYDSIGNAGYLNDLWKFSSGQWTWMGGGTLIDQSGQYGTLGIAGPGNVPGGGFGGVGWIDLSGNLWLLGGQHYDSVGSLQILNDLWEYEP